ncbi:hypothetical protein HN682_03320 [Candidatus Peregrinibacteria bacterium]|jgi:hypothetical protein|nr:hypothetical protein [Candidatus Peregrinibacteria bacterium]
MNKEQAEAIIRKAANGEIPIEYAGDDRLSKVEAEADLFMKTVFKMEQHDYLISDLSMFSDFDECGGVAIDTAVLIAKKMFGIEIDKDDYLVDIFERMASNDKKV